MFRRHLIAALMLGALSISLTGCNSGSSSTSPTSPIDLSPPQAPTNLHAVSDNAINRDWLMWDASASASVTGYEIYSAPTSSATGTLIATVDAAGTDYLLPLTNISSTEFYRVRAIGGNSVPSAFTSAIGVDRTAFGGSPTKGGTGKSGEGDF